MTDANRRDEERERSEVRLRAILDTMPQMVWSTSPDGFHDYYNDRWYEFTGVPHGSTDGEGWNDMFHPDDQERAWERWRYSLETGTPYEIEYRLRRHDGAYRWTLGRALPIRDQDGRIERWFGTCTDIHDLKQAEEQRELIARELSHRIKNIFAVVTSLVSLTARNDPDALGFAHRLRARLDALARAHEYVRPHGPESQPELHETLHGLLQSLVAPYEAPSGGTDPARFRIEGDDTPIGVGAATALALIVHELATNAVKYGALARPTGEVRIAGLSSGGTYTLTWDETGGPTIEAPPTRQGFGTVLAQRSATAQLGARIEQDWAPTGLRVRLTIPVDRFAR